ncbi:hypothetical protein NL676_039349 [Syzygium grande]|nr:hypothetical protein NL676_039349 [Syzygium grande]
MCEKSAIKKRHFHLNEETLKQHPALCSFGAASLNPRQDLTIDVLPRLGMEAATKAIEEWGQPKSMITHLVFYSTSGVDMPGVDLRLLKMLGLQRSNNRGARLLVVCAETTIISFQAPSEDNPVYLVSNALFGDGAAAMIIGAAPLPATTEQPIFQIISASQSVVPDSDKEIQGHHREAGLTMRISEKVPELISADLGENLAEAFRSINVTDWNSIFWAPHPGEGKATTGEGMEFGVLLGFGPGITIETVVLRSVPVVAG